MSFIQFMDTVATEIPSKWKRMGVAVGMSQSQIDAVDIHRRGQPFDCFSDVFKHWQDASTLEQPANWALPHYCAAFSNCWGGGIG